MKYIRTYEYSNEEDYNDKFIEYIRFGNFYKAYDLLEKYPVDIEYESEDAWTPLRMAISKDRAEIVEKLIELGVDIERVDDEGCTPLMTAGAYNHRDIIILLIEAGADWNAIDNRGYDSLDHMYDELKKEIIEDYPERYEEYLFKKEAERFNL
jgi:ankyrin repeat protein